MELKKRKRNRLEEYDYSTPNVYFITACTEGRRNLFWANINKNIDAPENVPLTELGVIVLRISEGSSTKKVIVKKPGGQPGFFVCRKPSLKFC